MLCHFACASLRNRAALHRFQSTSRCFTGFTPPPSLAPTSHTPCWSHITGSTPSTTPPLQWFHTTLTSHSTPALQAKDQLRSALATLNTASNHSSPSFNPSSSSNPSSSHRHQNNLPKCPALLSPKQPDHSHKRSRSFRALDKPIPTDETLPARAVCLSHEFHSKPVIYCAAEKTWDGKHETYAKRVERKLYLCANWQRAEGCADNHSLKHTCSGCGSSLYGAQCCPRAQKKLSPNSL
ncbi:hypothetical protein PAXRUDRAFT_781677 [Paxillus rubicundulus Ve08.2h10]|uniref:Uncharacterized protein n=1 Tax=Paxillus rubicundulus Ve08.2h10 TaxID=930991 RepID=A0A0D0DFG7_9AGAM|nr:hypothetical protein PAXRUDRAFT_781677 [Paxillus rubicundulus Ve08.2h10]